MKTSEVKSIHTTDMENELFLLHFSFIKRSSELKGVVGISLLGGGIDEKEWKDVAAMSRITMIKDGTPLRNGINIYNYALNHKYLNNVQMMARYRDAFLEWIEFFQHAHRMRDEAFLVELRTEEVKKAYERIRVKTFGENITLSYTYRLISEVRTEIEPLVK